MNLNSDEVLTSLQLRSRNGEGHRSLLSRSGINRARCNRAIPQPSTGVEVGTTNLFTVDTHRNSVIRVGGQHQVAARLLTSELDGGVGVDIGAGTQKRNLNGGVEVTGADTNRGLAGLPCFLRDIFQGEVEVVLPTVLTVRSLAGDHVLPLGGVGQNNLVLRGLVLRSFFLRVLGLGIGRLRLLSLRVLFLRRFSSRFCTRGSACRSTGISARCRISSSRGVSSSGRSLGRGLRGGRSRANRCYLNRSGGRVVIRAVHSTHKVTCVVGVVNLELRTRSASDDSVITQNLVANTTGILHRIPRQNVLIVL